MIKIDRKDMAMLKDSKKWTCWCYALLSASKQDEEVVHGEQIIKLQRGQFIFTRRECAEFLGMTEHEVRSAFSSLKEDGKVSVVGTNKFSIVTVETYGEHLFQEDGMSTKRKTASAKSDVSDMTKFISWWSYAFSKIHGYKYSFSGGKDASAAKKIVADAGGWMPAVVRACNFLLNDHEFNKTNHTISFFMARINTFSPSIELELLESARDIGIMPQPPQKLAMWDWNTA